MIAQMLVDLNLMKITFQDWSVRRFVTDYLADEEDLDSADWEDIWSETWEISIKTAQDPKRLVGGRELSRTRAYDETWKGEQMSFPVECEIFADFDNASAAERAAELLRSAAHISDVSVDGGRSRQPNSSIVAKRVRTIHTALVKPEFGRPAIAVQRGAWYPDQLRIRLGEFDETFFQKGTPLARQVSELCNELGARMLWDETGE
jgi:hypothetical protein